MEGKQNHVFQNWAHTYQCNPELYFEPETVQELRKILMQAKQYEKKVRVVGNGHSPSDLACTDDYMISMKKFNKVFRLTLMTIQ
jgi:L-gulonolactone oxidase